METVTTVTGDTTTVEVPVATGFRSATTVAFLGKTTQESVSSELKVLKICVGSKSADVPAMLAEGEGMLDSGLEESVREGVVDGAWLGEAELAVVFTLLEAAAGVPTALALAAPVTAAVPPTRRGLSSDCWMIFTPSGLVQADSLDLAL